MLIPFNGLEAYIKIILKAIKKIQITNILEKIIKLYYIYINGF